MKKLFVSFMAISLVLISTAQDSLDKNGYLSFTAACSFPVGGFASNNITKQNAGLAKKGVTVEIQYAHQFDELFGFQSAFVYGRFPLKNHSTPEHPIADVKPWEYYEFLIGPMITGSISSRTFLNASVLSGTAYINASKANVDGRLIQKKYSTSAVPLKCAVDLQFFLNRKFYLIAGINYNYMCANFNVTVEAQELQFKQRMSSMSIEAGMGWRLF